MLSLSILELFSLILLCVFSFPSLVVTAVIPCPVSPSLQVAIAWLSPFLAFVGDEAQVTPRCGRSCESLTLGVCLCRRYQSVRDAQRDAEEQPAAGGHHRESETRNQAAH